MKRPERILLLCAGGVAVASPLALSHVWLVYNGVHFKGPKVDFGAPPSRYALWASYGGMDTYPAWRPGTTYLMEGIDETGAASQRRQNKIQAVYKKAIGREQEGDFQGALRIWKSAFHRGIGDPWISRERIALLKEVASRGNVQGLSSFLDATSPVVDQRPLPPLSQVDVAIKPYVLYESASRDADGVASAGQLMAVASAYPHHPLAEPSLIMIPRKLLSNDAKPIGETNVKHAERALNLLHDRYPHSRFSAEAIGWRARLLYVQKLYDAARVIYKRQYDESSPAVRIHRPLDSLIWCDRMSGDVAAKAADFLIRWRDSNDNAERGRAALDVTASLDSFAGKDAERFWNLIRPDPNLLAAYIDFRVDVAEPGPDLLSLANKPKNWAHSSEASHIEARLSQAAYILHRYEAARRLALRVPREKAKRDDLALTEFVLASCLKHKGSYGAALSHYRHLVTHYPQSYLVGGAKENLALLYEREGRLDRALDLYRSMKYEFDVDYLIDIRMTPAELRNYVKSHTRDPRANLLRFSLGLRYLRAKQFGLAKAQLKTLTAAQRSKLLHPKDIYYMDDGPTTRVYDPLKTATELQHLTHLCARRKGSAKAAALTQLGDYYYSHRSLLLYNPSLWEGNRAYAIGFSWNDQVAGYHDKRALDRHHWEHECVAQAYLAYKRAVEAAPHSASSFRAAYMASCSLERLAGLNPYWRWEDNREDLYGRAIRYMRIAAGSPDRALRKKAVKYKGVFIEERKQRRSEFTPYHKVGEHYSGGY